MPAQVWHIQAKHLKSCLRCTESYCVHKAPMAFEDPQESDINASDAPPRFLCRHAWVLLGPLLSNDCAPLFARIMLPLPLRVCHHPASFCPCARRALLDHVFGDNPLGDFVCVLMGLVSSPLQM